jgi:tetratricopeptide (TPR) repeat protein
LGKPAFKSRLLDEFRQSLQGRMVTYLEGRCLSYGTTTPYLPILDLLRHHCGITEADRPEAITTKVQRALQEMGMDPDAGGPFLLHILGAPAGMERLPLLTPEVIKRRTFATLQQLSLNSSRQGPRILVVEDLHWIDATSEEWLVSLVDRLANAPLLLLTTYRPGYRPRWVDKSYATQMALPRLTRQESQSVVQSALHSAPIADAVLEAILEKGAGNPFFLEELARTAVESGEHGPTLAVPDTVQAVLASRLDRLPPEAKHLLQIAAVIGMEMPVALLQPIVELSEGELHDGLVTLQAAEFLSETRLFPEPAYTFKHILTQQVAYESLLQERRLALHARIVETLETLAGEGLRPAPTQSRQRLAEQVERLAYHALRGEVWDKALLYFRQAGEKAMARSAHREAVGSFEQALSALPHLPEMRDTHEQAIDLRLALRSALRPLGEFGRILACLREAESLATALDDPRRLGQVLVLLSNHFYLMGAFDQAIAAGQRALALATAGGEVVLQALANQYLGVAYHAQGDYRRAINHLRQTLASVEGTRRYERFGLANLPSVQCRTWLAVCHAELGLFAEGQVFGEEGLRIAEAVAHPVSLMWASYGIGLLFLRQGDLPRALSSLERAVDLCQDLPGLFPTMAAALGAAYTLGGRVSNAMPLLTQALQQSTATDMIYFQARCRLPLGEVHLLADRLEEAQTLTEHALAHACEHQERGHEAYALRLLGEIAAQRQPPEHERAEAYYRQAFALAEALGMRPLQAHCHRGLGMLYIKTSHKEQARTALSIAIELYRTMEMTLWLPETEAALAQVDAPSHQGGPSASAMLHTVQ